MPVNLINDFVLFPNPANWADAPTWKRIWETEVSESVTGAESRNALRSQPRVTLSWLITPRTLPEQLQLDDRLRAAAKSGKACAPLWGRASILAANVTNTTVNLSAPSWNWRVGDYIFFLDTNGNYDVRQLSAVIGAAFTLSQTVSRTYLAGSQVWPILFGKFSSENMEAVTSWHGSVNVTIQEMTPSGSAVVGSFTNGSDVGIGVMKIGSTFIVG
jgi:hypothetical protein